jgi:hypothetical protein
MPIANQAPDDNSDDVSSIDSNISNLVKRFIAPIDNIRSMSKPGSQTVSKTTNSIIPIAKNNFANLTINNSQSIESRAHAFYRMLGLPVAVASGGFYNPGFDPNAKETFTKHSGIDSKIDPAIQNMLDLREIVPQGKKQIFSNQDINASIYALLLRYPLPFNVLKQGLQPFDIDQQTFTVTTRADAANILALVNPDLSDAITSGASGFFGSAHILKPFIVDPRIASTVMPDSNSICVPFLPDKNSTKISGTNYLQRPGLEAIIRQRLTDQVTDVTFLNAVSNVISGQNSPSINTYNLNRQTLTDTIDALTANNNVSASATDSFSNFTNTQATMVSQLIQTIKTVIIQLASAMTKIDTVKLKINWFPVPSVDGPGTGSVGASLSRTGTSCAYSKLDNDIVQLRINKLNTQYQLTSQPDVGQFASPFSGSAAPDQIKVFNDQLEQSVSQRDKLAQDAFDAMGIIENITGEISGLGLIDVLAIYTALWAIDINTLVNFLDQDAFQRLSTYNPDLVNGLSDSTIPITKVLSTFETTLSNILSFADKLLENQFSSPFDMDGGSIM